MGHIDPKQIRDIISGLVLVGVIVGVVGVALVALISWGIYLLFT